MLGRFDAIATSLGQRRYASFCIQEAAVGALRASRFKKPYLNLMRWFDSLRIADRDAARTKTDSLESLKCCG